MTLPQYRRWLDGQLKEAEPLDQPSEQENPRGVVIEAAKRLGRFGQGSGELHERAHQVDSPASCAAVLIDCLAALPEGGPADPNALMPDDVAQMLGVAVDTVLGWINDRELRASNIAWRSSGRPRWIITRADLDMFLKNRQPEPAAAASSRSSSNSNGSIQFYRSGQPRFDVFGATS